MTRRVERAPDLGPTKAMLLLWVVPTAAYLVMIREPAPRWRATYFDDAVLEGTTSVGRARDVGDEEPLRARDHLGARWESCLTLEEDRRAAFQLTSSGKARLFIDDALVIDDWEVHERRSRGSEQVMAAGTHHVQVDLGAEDTQGVAILTASLDGERPRRIDPQLLHFPSDDARHPCGTRERSTERPE